MSKDYWEFEQLGITAEQIVSEAVKLALTHMLLEAEAGNNTVKIMHALDGIKVSSGGVHFSDEDQDVLLWDPRLSPPLTKSVAGLKGKKVSTISVAEMPRITPRAMDAAIKKQQALSGNTDQDFEETRL